MFFTNVDTQLFGVKKSGGPIVTVASSFVEPRGCVWDGDGSIFVADKAGNAVHSFPVSGKLKPTTTIRKVVSIEDAYGVAVLENVNGNASSANGMGVSTVLAAGVLVVQWIMAVGL